MLKFTFLFYLLCLVFSFNTVAQSSIIPFGSSWKYLDNGTNQGSNWRAVTFQDGSWKTGNGKFGYGISDAKTVVSFGPNSKKKYITTYFRKSVSITDASAYSSYTAKVNRDDGVVIYVNGREVYRNNMPTSSIAYTTLATTEATDNGSSSQSFTIPGSSFTSGTNVVAVEIHVSKVNTADMAFDLELVGNVVTPPADQIPPTVVSINRQNPTTESTSASSLTFRSTFSEQVTGVDAADFSVTATGTATGSVASVTAVGTNGSTYDVTVNAVSGEGTVRLDLKSSDTGITDAAENVITEGFTGGQSYTILLADQTPPFVISINRQNPTTAAITSTSVVFRTTFSEQVTGVDASDFAVVAVSGTVTGTLTSNAVAAVGTNGSIYDVTVSSINSSGTLRLDLKSSNTGIADKAGNLISGGYTSGETYTIEQTSMLTALPINFKSSWKYLDNGSNQGTSWRTLSFDDSNWKTGNGKFGYGISDAATVVSYGTNSSNKYITTYFRKSISIADASSYTSYSAKVNRDDGVVVYVNGAEVYRNNMPTGTISYTTLASGTSGGDDGATPIPFTIPASAFTTGVNVIAVEIHQASASSSDIAFDLELVGSSSPPPANQLPVVNISNPTNNSNFVLGQSVAIAATASDVDGSIIRVEFFANGSKIGENATSPYSYTWTPNSTGTYNLTAQATDNLGAITTSASVSINLMPSSQMITPLFVTEPVKYDSDDPAIWINKANPTESLIIATDKDADGALYVYNMEGKIVPEKVIRSLQRPNNVDVEYGLMLQDKSVDIAVTTERNTNKLRIFSLPEMRPVDNGGINVFVGETGIGYREPMGISLYKRPSDGKIYAIVSRKSGPTDGSYLWQYLLEDDGQGSVKGTPVRKFGKYSGKQEIEAIAVDDELGYVYYSDERAGVRKYFADPMNGNQELAFFATTGFTADHEGIAIYKIEDGTGYILVNDQSANELHIFTREGTAANPHDHQLVKIVATSTSDSDGSEVANYSILPHFPNGVFVGMSTDRTYQLYRWEDIAGNDLKVQPPQILYTENQSPIQSVLKEVATHPAQFNIYPNPVRKGTVITIELESRETNEIFVLDVTGRILYTRKFNGATSIETTNLPTGMYFVGLLWKKQLKKYKFIVTN